MHGSVDSTGTSKLRQIGESSWIGVELEEWDEEVHGPVTGPIDFEDFFWREDDRSRGESGQELM